MACTALMTGGCEAVVMGVAAPGIIKQDRVNLLNASYAAADTLSQQSKKTFSFDTPLHVSTLTEMVDMSVEHPKANPKVGQVLADQLRERFVQLGYTVPEGNYHGGGTGEVSGTYDIKDGTMTVHLTMTNHATREIVGVYDYALPVTYDIKKYMTRDANSMPVLPPIL